MNIDINKLNEIKTDLDEIKENDALFIEENGEVKYAIMPIERFDKAEELLEMFDDMNNFKPQIKVIGSNEDITYEEYERIKASINEVIDKTFKPKAEKLN